MAKINVQQTAITLLKVNGQDYISLTDIARRPNSRDRQLDAQPQHNRIFGRLGNFVQSQF